MEALYAQKATILIRSDPTITVTEGTDISGAISTLFKSGKQSCPVVDKDGKLIGLLDVVDVAVHIVELLGGAKKMLQWLVETGLMPVEHQDQYEKIVGTDPEDKITDEEVAELSAPNIDMADLVDDLIDRSKRNHSAPIKEDTLIREVVNLLKTHRRVPVVNFHGKLVNLVTQSDIITFLKFDDSLLGAHGQKTLKELGIAEPKTVVSVLDTDQALAAFKKISKNNVSAVAVVNAQGIIVGNISATDVRLIDGSGDLISRMFLKASEFLTRMQAEHVIPPKPLTVMPTSTLNDALRLMVTHKVHRVYVVSDKTKQVPVGVVSMTDILSILN